MSKKNKYKDEVIKGFHDTLSNAITVLDEKLPNKTPFKTNGTKNKKTKQKN